MTKINLESLPELVSKKVVSKTQAVNIVWEELYMNPHKYGLNSFSEDQKSDFLIIMHGIFEKIFDKFIPGGSVTFTAFITGCIANYKMAFLRRLFEEENEMKSISAILRNETEEKTWENRLSLPEDLDENEAESLQEKKTLLFYMGKDDVGGNKRAIGIEGPIHDTRVRVLHYIHLAGLGFGIVVDVLIEVVLTFPSTDEVFSCFGQFLTCHFGNNREINVGLHLSEVYDSKIFLETFDGYGITIFVFTV